jgi:hypothetical protein
LAQLRGSKDESVWTVEDRCEAKRAKKDREIFAMPRLAGKGQEKKKQ